MTETAARVPSTARARLDARLELLRRSTAYGNYLTARERVLEMKDLESRAATCGSPSAYWEEELAHFDYLADASPLVVEKLRQHTSHVTGVRAYDYRGNRDRAKQRFVNKLNMLRKRDRAGLLVPESPMLGGFGFDIDGARYNLDTLKFYEVLIALDMAAILGEFRQTEERRLVWEIGSGWGGLAYQFKTLFPRVTYVLTDLPELFLLSGTYLTTVLPDAHVAFVTDERPDDVWSRWREYDLIFVGHTEVETMQPDRIDLMLNAMSFQKMTSAQIDRYVRAAFELGCPAIYSLHRERSGYNLEQTAVSEILDAYYWLRQVDVLPVSYQNKIDEERSEGTYRHVVGWRRVKTR